MSETVTIVTHRLVQRGRPVRWLTFDCGDGLRTRLAESDLIGQGDPTIEEVLSVDQEQIPDDSAFKLASRGDVPFGELEQRQLGEIRAILGAASLNTSI